MDELRKQSDKELKKIEDEIERIYKDAEGDLKDKWNKYMSRAEKRLEGAEKALQDAMKTGDADAIAAAKAALTQKKQAVFFRDKQFSEMVDAVTDRMANVNQLAADYVNGQMPRMYSYNYNGSLREVQKDADAAGISGIAFNMIDDATVERMQKRGEVTLPKRKIDVPKDKQWNRKAINAQIMQGIIQGESIPQMSKRLREVTDMNKNSSIRNARTLTTEAENGGRLDSMKTASDLGLEYEKTWIATHDERTRLSHALIDGESVPLDEKFSNGLQYPADPSGPPEEVYNCRCSLVRKLIGYKGHAIDDIGSYEPTYFDDVKEQVAEQKPYDEEIETDEYNSKTTSEQIETPAMNEYQYWSEEQTKFRFDEIQKQTGFDEKKTQDVLTAFCGDSSEYYGIENTPEGWFYRADTRIRDLDGEKWTNAAKTIDDYIVAAPKYEGSIFRGLSLDAETVKGIQKGGTFTEKGSLSSWTSGADIAQMFAEGRTEELGLTPVVIETKAHPFASPVSHLSVFGSEESEVIVSNMHGNEYMIEDVEEKDGILHVILTFGGK